MTAQQRQDLVTMLSEGPLDFAGDLAEQRRIFTRMLTAHPHPDDVRTTEELLGGVPAIRVDIDGVAPDGSTDATTMLYLHGGAYVMGSALGSVGLVQDLVRRTGFPALTVDYRLAPEHPFPAAVDDAVEAYRALLRQVPAKAVVLVGESAGGGLVLSTLLALRDAGDPLPRAAAVFSPWADLTVSGETATTHARQDVSVSPDGLRLRAPQYAGAEGTASPSVSPALADLRGLPPLLVQVGGDEVLLDDSLRVASSAARSGVEVSLQVTPGVPHVFQAFAAILDEGSAALDEAARFLRAPRAV